MTFPWTGNDDQMPHVDYIWQVSQGKLPEFKDGVQYHLIKGFPYQYVANHPPLYYFLQAIVLKIPLEHDNLKLAVALGRAVNIILGVCCILAFAWAGWVFSRGNYVFTLALPAVGAFYITFILVIGNIMNDSLTVLLATVSLTLSYLILREGPLRRYLYWLAFVSALGLLSRAIYFVPLFISLIAVVISYATVKERKINIKKGFKGASVAMLLFVVALLPSSWFYLRNYQQSGTFYKDSRGTNSITAHRQYKSLPEVLSSPDLYKAATLTPLGRVHDGSISVLFTILAVLSACLWVSRKRRWETLLRNRALLIATGLLAGYFLLILAGQIEHAWGYGQYSARYFLPALLPVVLVTTLGIYAWRRSLPLLLAIFMTSSAALALWQIANRLATRQPELYGNLNWGEVIKASIVNNGVPLGVAYVITAALLVGVGCLSVTVWRLNRTSKGTSR
jgi:hypothetical protein